MSFALTSPPYPTLPPHFLYSPACTLTTPAHCLRGPNPSLLLEEQPTVFASIANGSVTSIGRDGSASIAGLADVKDALPTLRHVMRALNAERDADAPVGIPALPDNDYGGAGSE
jgi:hypothetical protein